MFWQRPRFIAKFQSLPRQISQFRGHFENRLEKNEKNRIASNKCDICTLDIMIDDDNDNLLKSMPNFGLNFRQTKCWP